MSLQRRAAPGTDPQPRPSGLDLPGLDWASVSREADIAHLGLPWGVSGTRRRKCFLSAWRGAGAPRGDGDPAHGQAVWGRGLEPPVSGLNSVHSAENRGVWPTVSTRISCGYRSGAARSKPRSCGVVRGVKPGGRNRLGIWDLRRFRPQAVCTCCSLCPGAVPFVFARPVSASPLGLRLDAAAPGSPAPSAGGSPACVSCECQGRARGGGGACVAWDVAVHRSCPAPAPGRPPPRSMACGASRRYLALGCLRPSAELSGKWPEGARL